jgi:hypothetical protein
MTEQAMAGRPEATNGYQRLAILLAMAMFVFGSSATRCEVLKSLWR